MTNENPLAGIEIFLSFSETTVVENKIPALSIRAKRAGLRDIYNRANKKRMIVSPDHLDEYFKSLKATIGMSIPESMGKVKIGDQQFSIYSIPSNTITLEALSLTNPSVQHRVTFDIEGTLKNIETNNPHMDKRMFKDYTHYWSADLTNLTLVPIYYPPKNE